MAIPEEPDARSTYQAFAPIYNEFNRANDYEQWLGAALLPELEARGLRRGRALDVGCGTGRAFEPLRSRGWEVIGCDISEAMLERARADHPEVELHVADARELPHFGSFELALLLNDVVNYLVDEDDLAGALRSVRTNLADDGLVVFDTGTLSFFRDSFGLGGDGSTDERGWRWRGLTASSDAGTVFQAEISGEGVATHVHHQRHWPVAAVESAMRGAGIEPLAALGQDEVDGRIVLRDEIDERRDYKAVHVGRLT